MKKMTGVLLVCLLLYPAAALPEYVKTKIAVLDFELKGEGYETEDMGEIVAEWFITALVKEGRFDVIERSLLNKILEEQKLSISGIIDEGTATQLGKLLGVKVIISGSVLKFTSTLEVNARIIDVETASIIAAENVRSGTAERLKDLVDQMSVKIMKHFPLEGYVVSRGPEENMITIDLGKYSGVKTGIEFTVFKEGKAIKHPKTGEVLDVERTNLGRAVIVDVRDKIAKAQILDESFAGAIQFGQRVKSVSPLPSAAATGGNPSGAVQAPPQAGRDTAPVAGISIQQIVTLLRSPVPMQKTQGARLVVRYYPENAELLAVVEDELLKGYKAETQDKRHVEAMGWMCNALGRSGQSQYKDTLKEVAQNAKNRRIRGYAKKNAKRIR